MQNLASQGLVAMTVKQITDCFLSGGNKSDLFINGISLKHFSLVGLVSDKDVSNLTFTLHDETGQINCKIRKVDKTSDAKIMESAREGSFVRLKGYLDITQGKTQLTVFFVSPIFNFNKVIFHSKKNSKSHIINFHKVIFYSKKNSESQFSDVTHTTFQAGSNTNQAASLKMTLKLILRCPVTDPSTVPSIKQLLAQAGLCCYYSSRHSVLFVYRIFRGLKKPSQKGCFQPSNTGKPHSTPTPAPEKYIIPARRQKKEFFSGSVTENASPSPRDVPIPRFFRKDIIRAEYVKLTMAWLERTRKQSDII